MNIKTVKDWMDEIERVKPSKSFDADVITGVVEELFSKYLDKNDIKMVFITGSTPYFNDGDPCVHSAEFIWVSEFPDSLNIDEFISNVESKYRSGWHLYDDLPAGFVIAKDSTLKFDMRSTIWSFEERMLQFMYTTNFNFVMIKDAAGKVRWTQYWYEPSY